MGHGSISDMIWRHDELIDKLEDGTITKEEKQELVDLDSILFELDIVGIEPMGEEA